MTTVSAPRILAAVCFAQVFAQIGAYTLPALLPTFIREWSLSNTEVGWLIGVFYASYVLAVPVLVSLTDRIDARSVYIFSVTLTIISHLGFAFFAAINIHTDNKAKIMPEDNEVIKERTFPLTNISTGDNHLIA